MTKPILLLDVDEVLNPNGRAADRCPDWTWEPAFFSDVASGMFMLTISREMGDAIASLGCDIRWLTTWEDHANTNIGPRLGWPTLPVVHKLPFDDSILWKARAARDVLAHPGPPVVWIDDEAQRLVDLFDDRSDLDPHGRLVCVIAPEFGVGLTRAQIEEVRTTLARRAAA